MRTVNFSGSILLSIALIAMAGSACAESPPTEISASTDLGISAAQKVENQQQQAKIRAKFREVMASPDFSTEQTMRIPSLKPNPAQDTPDWMKYLERFGRFLAGLLRAGVWILGGIAIAVLLVSLHRWWRIAGQRVQVKRVSVPTHIGALDIRATSLPDDVSAAARQRWQAGDITGSLSLLYRGALSSLVLRFDAPIRSSYTEAECLRVAKARLPAALFAYFDLLTRAWLQTVYAGRSPNDAAGQALCDSFAAHFQSGGTSGAAPSVSGRTVGAKA
ncbi:MAG: hypothetical protein ABI583_08550 [Betaproteobacteria bacterium]